MLRQWTALAVLAAALGACAPAAPESRPATSEPPMPAGQGAPEAGPPTSVVVAETATAGPAATAKADFVATDPGTVRLAAGRPQLVEFYARW
jgi:hypothetical protein